MSKCVQPYYLKDGSFLDCSSFHMGLLNEGRSIYEVARLSGNRLLFLEDHLERFTGSLQLEGLDSWLGKEDIIRSLEELIRKNRATEGNIKFVMNFRSTEDHHFIAYFVAHRYPTDIDYKNGVKITAFPFERTNPNKKVWRPEFRREIADFLNKNQAFEALLINSENCIPEASKSNVFALINDEIITPPDELILPGITRKHVLGVCRDMGIPVKMRTIRMEEIRDLDGLFLTGTSLHVLPVSNVNDILLPTGNQTVQKIMDQFQKIILKSSEINHLNT